MVNGIVATHEIVLGAHMCAKLEEHFDGHTQQNPEEVLELHDPHRGWDWLSTDG
jgi:hypothetical protein